MAEPVEPSGARPGPLQLGAEVVDQAPGVARERFRRADRLGEAALDDRPLRLEDGRDRFEHPAEGLVEPSPDLRSEPQDQGRPGLALQVENGLEPQATEALRQIGREPEGRDREVRERPADLALRDPGRGGGESLLETGQEARLVARLQIEQTVRIQARLAQRRSEEVGPGDAPKHWARKPRGDPGGEEGRRRPVDGAVAAPGDLVQGAARQAAFGQGRIEAGDAERQDAGRPAALRLEMPDAGAQGGELGGGPRDHGGLLPRANVHLLFWFPFRGGVNWRRDVSARIAVNPSARSGVLTFEESR